MPTTTLKSESCRGHVAHVQRSGESRLGHPDVAGGVVDRPARWTEGLRRRRRALAVCCRVARHLGVRHSAGRLEGVDPHVLREAARAAADVTALPATEQLGTRRPSGPLSRPPCDHRGRHVGRADDLLRLEVRVDSRAPARSERDDGDAEAIRIAPETKPPISKNFFMTPSWNLVHVPQCPEALATGHPQSPQVGCGFCGVQRTGDARKLRSSPRAWWGRCPDAAPVSPGECVPIEMAQLAYTTGSHRVAAPEAGRGFDAWHHDGSRAYSPTTAWISKPSVGDVDALLGENGAGKTTLSHILTGLSRADEGEIRVYGQAVAFASPRDAIDAGVCMVHQQVRLVERFSVAENLILGDRRGAGRQFVIDPAAVERQVREPGERNPPDARGSARAESGSSRWGEVMRRDLGRALPGRGAHPDLGRTDLRCRHRTRRAGSS